jgi:hypothetical protein
MRRAQKTYDTACGYDHSTHTYPRSINQGSGADDLKAPKGGVVQHPQNLGPGQRPPEGL